MAAENSRHSIAGAIPDLFASTPTRPSAVLLVGEPGIGKTTQLRAAAAEASALKFTVLSTTGSVAESAPSYAALAGLLTSVRTDVLATLPAPQRNALEQVLRSDPDSAPTDQRAVAAGFLSTIRALADRSPVLIVLDDVQWLDPSSAAVLSFAARRFVGPVSVLAGVRADSVATAAWMESAWPNDLRQISVPPLKLGTMHAMIQQRQGHSLPRPALTRIHRISGGNPFYALELSRTVDWAAELPLTLAQVVESRLAGLGADAEEILLAAACATAPTVGLIRRVTGLDIGDVTHLLERAEDAGVLTLDGVRVSFTHPLLAQGVLSSADASRRRTVHRRLADAVTEPESHARHLALAASGDDPAAVDALDKAAESAQFRGAPEAAAELTELALSLGGGTPQRRINLARHLFDAGDAAYARRLLEALIAENPAGPIRSRSYLLLGTVRMFGDNWGEAAEVLRTALDDGVDDPSLEVVMRVLLALAQANAGLIDEGVASATKAVTVAERAAVPALVSQALAMRASLGFKAGEGFDEESMRIALELEGDASLIHIAMRPSAMSAFLNAWTGRDPLAHNVIREMRREFVETGDENGLNIVTFMSIVADVIYGAYAEAAVTARDALERAQQSGGDVALLAAQTVRATVAAHTGDVESTREAVDAALEVAERSASHVIALRARAQLAFAEVSLENYDAAWAALQPLVAALESRPAATEIITAMFVPDAIETALATGRTAVAESLVTLMETNGRRVGRTWMLAVAARGRAMIDAANGDVASAVASAQRANAEYDRLPMPFEKARTQLVLGQLLHRQRAKDAATSMLGEALATFDALGSPLWADRARAELARVRADGRRRELTAAETRVARLVTNGMTNREVAAALLISPKTVEANLARVYRKLGIRTRAELGTRMASGGTPLEQD